MPISNAVIRPEQFPIGSFCSLEAQSNTDHGNPITTVFKTTLTKRGIDIVGNGRIKVSNPGAYNFKFNVQISCVTASGVPVSFWLSKNGVKVDNSTKIVSYPGSEVDMAVSLETVLEMDADDHVELIWLCSDADMILAFYAAGATLPAMPSAAVIVTCVSG
jgi:hypothetical protein